MSVHSSFSKSIFPEQLKVSEVYPIFKVGNIEEVGNHRSVLALPILEKIMYNDTYQYFKENDRLFPK